MRRIATIVMMYCRGGIGVEIEVGRKLHLFLWCTYDLIATSGSSLLYVAVFCNTSARSEAHTHTYIYDCETCIRYLCCQVVGVALEKSICARQKVYCGMLLDLIRHGAKSSLHARTYVSCCQQQKDCAYLSNISIRQYDMIIADDGHHSLGPLAIALPATCLCTFYRSILQL